MRVFTSHKRMVSSRPPVARLRPSGEKRTARTAPSWPSSVATTDRLATSQTLSSPCAPGRFSGVPPPVTRRAPSREKATHVDGPAQVGEPGRLRAGLDIPERDDIPFAGGGQQPSVGRESQLGDPAQPRQLMPAVRRSRHPRSGSCRHSFPRRDSCRPARRRR